MRGETAAEQDEQITDVAASVFHQEAFSGIVNLCGTRTPRIIEAKANTNLIHRRTLIPMLESAFKKGRHYLGCAVLGEVAEDFSENIWNGCPAISIADGVAKVCYHGREAKIIELQIDIG